MRQPEKKKFWSFQKKEPSVGELFLYGDIESSTWWGDEITPKSFKDDMDALGDIDELRVYVNSGGGDVFAGWNIINMLKRHKARKIGYNDGLAASIAFDILMSMDQVIAMEASMFMTHNCWTWARGDRHALREQADMMEKIDGMLAETSSKKSGKTVEEIMALQDAESWFTASEALSEGFADEVQKGNQLAAKLESGFLVIGKERFDTLRYKNPPVINLPNLDAPCDGGESQPVKDMNTAPDALQNQRADFRRIREKLLGGN